MKKEFVRNPYNYDSDAVSDATGLLCADEHRTEQEHILEADINYIAERFMRTGEAPQVLNLPTAGDFSGIFDFQTAMNTISQAKQEFMSLPAKTRARFNNDPAELLAFVEDSTNREEAVKLGFIPPSPAEKEKLHETGTRGPAQETTQTGTRSTGAPQDQATAGGDQKP